MGVAQSNKLREIDRVKVRPVTGDHPEFGLRIRRLLGWGDNNERQFLTARDAARLTDISVVTILKMADGHPPKANTILKFADRLKVDATPLLRDAGYIPTSSSARVPDHSTGEDDDANLISASRASTELTIPDNIPDILAALSGAIKRSPNIYDKEWSWRRDPEFLDYLEIHGLTIVDVDVVLGMLTNALDQPTPDAFVQFIETATKSSEGAEDRDA